MAEQSLVKKLTIADEESSSIPKETKSLTNIYYDCLEHIFDYLDLQSLMNVACTCKRLKIAAAAKFYDDHGKKSITLTPRELHFEPMEIVIHSEKINVIGLKLCRSFLWSFGTKISHLVLCEVNTSDFFENLEQDINKYCADTLKILEFEYRRYKKYFSSENNPKPFKHVEKVVIESCDLHGQFARINDMFPNLRDLSLAEVNIDKDFTAAVSMPHLERLDILWWPYNSFDLKKATDMIKANRQLQELQICSHSHFQEFKLAPLLDMISENTSISKLSVTSELTNVTTDELMRFAVEHSSMVDLDFWCYRMTADDVIVLMRKLNSLKKFQFKLVDGSQYDVLKNQLKEEWKIEHVNDENEDVPVSDRFTYVLTR